MASKTGLKVVGGLLLLALLLGGIGWWYRDSIPGLWGREATEVSPEAAVVAEEKLRRLREEGEEVRLSAVELSSLLRYRASEWALPGVADPSVAMSGDTLRLYGSIPTEHLPAHPELDRVRGFLPDTARVEVAGGLRTLARGRAALEIRALEFAGIPIPERYYAPILDRLGRRDEPGLAPTALVLGLPTGVGGARVENGTLVLSP